MAVNIYVPFSDDGLEPEEQKLYDMVNQYRTQNGLATIPISKALTLVANRHVHDLTSNIGKLTHSWSDASYSSNPTAMWEAPQRFSTGYTGNGYENAYWSSSGATADGALLSWKNSPGHNEVLLNLGIWQSSTWKAIGVGIYGEYAVLWVGEVTDSTGTPSTTPPPTPPTTDNNYIVNSIADVVTEQVNGGWDVVTSNLDNYTLPANVEVLRFGTSISTGTGNAGNNYLLGNALDNTLNGGAGADVMAAYAGNDTYFVDNARDIVVEAVNEGTDTVNASISYTLTANVEILNLLGTTVGGFGNALNNTITGNAADNLLNGDVGIDTVIGGAGNDYYFVDNTTDVITELVNEGTDIVYSTAVSYTLPTNVEHLVVWGAGLNGTGNASNNIIFGSALNNTLADDVGSDILVGGRGQDIYNLSVDNTTDTLYISAGDSLVTNYDKANNFSLGSSATSALGSDNLNLPTTLIAANTAAVGGSAVGSITGAAISNGIIHFQGAGSAVLNATSIVLADALSYVQNNIKGGNTVAFIAGGDTFVFQDAGANDILIDLVGVVATSVNNTGLGAGSVWVI